MISLPVHIHFCPRCGGALEQREINGHPRLVCAACGRVHYRNPAVGVAVIVRQGEEILWGRRTGGQYAGAWCLPCGYVEWGEEVPDAALREFLEETGLKVELGEVLAIHSNFHDPERLTVGLWFAGKVVGGVLKAGDDLDRLDFFPIAAPPQPLAFPSAWSGQGYPGARAPEDGAPSDHSSKGRRPSIRRAARDPGPGADGWGIHGGGGSHPPGR